jgi:hypothetical protein
MAKFNQTNPDLPPFKRHLEACGINVKMDKARRAKKFLWGNKSSIATLWLSLDSLSETHLRNIKTYLANYKHSFEDEQIGWVFDLVDYTLEHKVK